MYIQYFWRNDFSGMGSTTLPFVVNGDGVLSCVVYVVSPGGVDRCSTFVPQESGYPRSYVTVI